MEKDGVRFPTPAPQIDFVDLQWEETGTEDDPKARLSSAVIIAGQYMHLEAWAVREDKEKGLVSDFYPEDFRKWWSGLEPGATFQTTEICGRKYVLVAFPFCN